MICKTYVCINCLFVLSICTVCNVDVLWPNGWMDQDATWHGGRPRPRHITLHIVSDDDPTPYPLKGTQPVSPIFGPYLLWPNGWMDQDAACRDVGLGQSDIVLDGVPAPPPKKGHSHPLFGPCLLWLPTYLDPPDPHGAGSRLITGHFGPKTFRY